MIIKKFFNSLQRDGLINTALRVFKYPINKLKHKRFEKTVLTLKSAEDRFTWISKNNYWSNEESVSGTGSTLQYTENLRKELPKLVNDYSIQIIFDAPCGDFNWMKHLLPELNLQYIGGDIVRPLIESHSSKYMNEQTTFIHIDLIKDKFPRADLMICRDCLFHLSFDDTKSVLKNFVDSNISYLLTTTYRNTDRFVNKDIKTGDYRLIDLFSSPYCFPTALASIDDWLPPDPERQMCLWSREQVSKALSNFN